MYLELVLDHPPLGLTHSSYCLMSLVCVSQFPSHRYEDTGGELSLKLSGVCAWRPLSERTRTAAAAGEDRTAAVASGRTRQRAGLDSAQQTASNTPDQGQGSEVI